MVTIENDSGNTTILTHQVRLHFAWNGDRWKHEMVSLGHSASIPRIWSVEMNPGCDDSDRCDGPIYRRLAAAEVDQLGIGRVTLDGRSGQHGFTASFTVEERPEEVIIEVELADHCQTPISSLAATYLVESSDGVMTSGEAATITWCDPSSRLIFEPDRPAGIDTHEASFGTIRLRAVSTVTPPAGDLALRYRWHWIVMPHHRIWDREA